MDQALSRPAVCNLRVDENPPGLRVVLFEIREDTYSDMKIYLGFTVAGDRSSMVGARKIVELVEQMGHEVLTRHLVEDNAWEEDRLITPKEVYLRDMKWLEQCDLFMAEVSGSSFGVGFETGYLLGATTKKVVLFYRRDVETKISLLITGITHPNCRLAPYSDLNEVEIWIRNNLSQ
jgi:hypothetical protein